MSVAMTVSQSAKGDDDECDGNVGGDDDDVGDDDVGGNDVGGNDVDGGCGQRQRRRCDDDDNKNCDASVRRRRGL